MFTPLQAARHGPFVMNTREELAQAYHSGRFLMNRICLLMMLSLNKKIVERTLFLIETKTNITYELK